MAKEDAPDSGLNNNDIRQLIRILSRTDVEELELERAGSRVRLRRFSRSVAAPVVADQPMPSAPPPVAANVTSPPQTAAPEVGAKEPMLSKGQKTITSPIVGTFYRASSPDAAPFVQEGDTAKAGQTLCIIEAMKLMNEVEAEYDCRIVSCLVEDATPVEYGEMLFVVEPL